MIIIRASHKVVGRIKRNEVWWESKVSWTSITKHCKTSGTALRSTKLQVTRVLLNTFFSSTVYTLCKKTQKKKKTVFFFFPPGLEKQLLFLKDQNAHEALRGNLAPDTPWDFECTISWDLISFFTSPYRFSDPLFLFFSGKPHIEPES